ncbi:translin-associated protein X [Anopheles bellator]|uniref:translin-associated protein X n=1 Tax=Anopheles bellator TaxID=139047 RepID=UPI0026470CC7|nr:translin-associated protein X [Anopheles bellator]
MSQNRGNARRFVRPGGRGGCGRRGKDGEGADDATGPLLDKNNPIMQCFRQYALELDAKHDRYERIVKCSRDITIESKRIIFLLHTIDPRKNNEAKVCEEAKNRLEALFRNQFFGIAKELQGKDAYQYARAYTNGMQEFIEAFTFYQYSSGQDISDWQAIQRRLSYEQHPDPTRTEPSLPSDQNECESAQEGKNDEQGTAMVCLQPLDFVLGLGDLSGEVMRKCINALGSGQVDSCFIHCRFLQDLYRGFVSVSSARSREFSHKMSTMRQSLLKSEKVCYNVTVRGSEAAKWGSSEDGFASFLHHQSSKDTEAAGGDDDEGVFF